MTVANLPIEGELPAGLRGSFLRNGPNTVPFGFHGSFVPEAS